MDNPELENRDLPPPEMGKPSSKIPMITMGVCGLVQAVIGVGSIVAPEIAYASQEGSPLTKSIGTLVMGSGFMFLAYLSWLRRR